MSSPVNDAPRRSRWALTRAQWMAAALSGALFAVAFPPMPLFVPIFLCLAPLAVVIAGDADGGANRLASGWSAWRTGALFGLIGYGANLYWIAVALLLYTKMAIAGYLGALVWLIPFIGLAAAVLFHLRRATRWPMAILLPIVWVALELLLNYLSDLSFPWLPLGLSVARMPVLAQFADMSGVRGVSFWIAAVNGLVADAWLLRKQQHASVIRLVGALGILASAELYGEWREVSTPLTPLARMTVVQPNIPERAKLTIEDPTSHVALLASLTRAELRRNSSDLVIWPEAALDRFLWQHPDWLDSLQATVQEHPTPIITGTLDSNSPMEVPFRYYNAAILTDANGRLTTQPAYHKQYLVPIVERVPFLNPEWFKGVNYFGGFGRGDSERPFDLPFGKAGVLICYEAIYPQLTRAYAQQGATVLINVTNDAWFQHSLAPYQHFAHLALRAIETRRPVVRAANTGISGYIDPLGRVIEETPIFTEYTGTYAVRTSAVMTPYVRFGDWLSLLCAGVTVVLLARVLIRRR